MFRVWTGQLLSASASTSSFADGRVKAGTSDQISHAQKPPESLWLHQPHTSLKTNMVIIFGIRFVCQQMVKYLESYIYTIIDTYCITLS